MERSPIQPKKQDSRMRSGGGVAGNRDGGGVGQSLKRGVVGNIGGSS